MLLDHYLPHLFENFKQFNVYTHKTQGSSALYNQQNSLTFVLFAPCIVI